MTIIAAQLRLLLWKNCIIRKRHYILSIFEILMSLLIFSLLSFVQNTSPEFSQVYPNENQYHVTQKAHFELSCTILYTPKVEILEKLMEKVKEEMENIKLEPCETENEMEEWVQSYVANQTKFNFTMPVGIVFEKYPKDETDKYITYQLRTDLQIQLGSLFDNAEPFHSYGKYDYFDHFIPTQEAIARAITKLLKDPTSLWVRIVNYFYPPHIPVLHDIYYMEMTYPPHIDRGKLKMLFVILPLLIILALIFVFTSVLRLVIEEKSTGIKELMKIMGIDTWSLWLGWFMHFMITSVVAITIIVLILTVNLSVKTHSLIEYSNPSVIWIFLFFYCSAAICFCFFISTLFMNPTLGMCVGMMIWVVTYFVISPLVMTVDPNAYTFLRYFMILPNVCLIYGFKAISDFELKGNGVTWAHFLEKPNKYTPHPSIGFVVLMLIIDCIIFLIFTWYIENVFPGEYGIAKPWGYPFTKSYWRTSNGGSVGNDQLEHIQGRDLEGIETVPEDTSTGVQIRNLSKSFHKKQAVDDLSFDIYENEITMLLGQNGAGKTTTMNIITGMVSPNSGTVLVNGFNIQCNINKARESLGHCPQHNLQFSDLTVLENLMFFAMLKSSSKTAAKLESEEFLSRLNMVSKANNMTSEISGGMRRKLSLGMALVGHTRVLILDEPTSGIDPEGRREIWDILLSMREERTILITTHYMLEADVLADRIAIMHHGQLMCYGTSLFLKNHYDTGYTLSLMVTKSRNIDKLTEVIQNEIASARVKDITTGRVTFALPTNDTEALSALLSNLEMNKSQLSISTFNVTPTSMEDVYLRVNEIAEEIDKTLPCEPKNDLLRRRSLLCHQFYGLFIKRCQYARYRWIMFLLQVLIPLALVMLIIMPTSKNATEPVLRRDMVLNPYPRSEAIAEDNVTEFRHFYKYVVESQHGKMTLANYSETFPSSISQGIIDIGIEDLDRYHHSLIAGFSSKYIDTNNKLAYYCHYGNWALHGPPISLNLITSAYLMMISNDTTFGITVHNRPWPHFLPKTQIKFNMVVITTWIFLFPIALTLMVGFFLVFPQEERLTRVKHLQLMTGVPRVLYWAVIYLFDLIVYVTVTVLIIIIVISFDIGGPFGNGPSLQALSILTFFYGFSILPFAYMFTYTSTAATSVTCLLGSQLICGTIATATVFSLNILGNKYMEISKGLTYFFYIFPNFAFTNGIYKYITHTGQIYYWDNLYPRHKDRYCQFSTMPCCEEYSLECKEFYSYYAGEFSITPNIFFLIIHIFLYISILFLLDSGMPRKLIDLFDYKVSADAALSQDVAEEKQRIQNQINGVTRLQKDVLQVTNLRKYYGKFYGKVYAVRGLNFGVKSGEIFGLLGTNGSGKTTVFKMLTGEIFPTTGTANLMDYQLQRPPYLKQIGYCPQFDALNYSLTIRQMLQLFAYLRGIPAHRIRDNERKWLNIFGLKQYENIRCVNLSGGNKRRLSTAVALIGNPPLVILDLPTSSVDPVGRRNFLDFLAELRQPGQSIIFTSHSMDECEALCDRLAIMVDGQMKCIGNIQHLQSKYGQGLTVMMKLKPDVVLSGDTTESVDKIEGIKRKFESKYSSTLEDEHTGTLLYHVTNTKAKIGELFHYLEELKTNVPILADYSIYEKNLEQVFLSLAKCEIKDLGRCNVCTNTRVIIDDLIKYFRQFWLQKSQLWQQNSDSK